MHLIVSQAEEELAERRQELARLTALLAQRELELTELRAAHSRLQNRYFLLMGRRYVELDDLRARIARKRAERNPEDEEAAREALHFRYRADRSADYHHSGEGCQEAIFPEEKAVSEENKKLYRSIAGQIHPDRAKTEKSRALRTALMAELNAAYAAGETARMRAILEEWRLSPESIAGEGPEAELLRLNRTIARMEQRLRRIEKETGRINSSTMGRLLRQVREATARGRDLLAELAAELDRKIELARQELEEIIEENR